MFDSVPGISLSEWQLHAAGRTWSYDELAVFADELTATIDCTGGWYSEQDWQGARVDRLLERTRTSGVESFVVRSRTGYSRRFPIADAARMLLATRVGGNQLDAAHGFPARLVVPGRRGFEWVKWVDRIELDELPAWWQSPFPLQ
jgi:DMSO/TMAO reductase YedYZ molybdopterin-dependent catalytic subunit